MARTTLPLVSTCSVAACSYNHDHDCHAGAITVVGSTSACSTYVDVDTKGGLDATAQVGACHRSDCRHNSSLECTASAVEIGADRDVADCLTFAVA